MAAHKDCYMKLEPQHNPLPCSSAALASEIEAHKETKNLIAQN